MAATRNPAVRNPERFWREARSKTTSEHVHVALVGLDTFETKELHARVEAGLSYDAVERLRAVLDLPLARLSALLGVPARTLARRREGGTLHPDESDRLIRLSRITGLALGLYKGDLAEARSWLGAPQIALGGRTPLEFATTEVGAREVERVIGRIEHGIPS